MNIHRISGFSVAGLNTDINPTDLKDSFNTRLVNVRMKNGGMTPFGGHEHIANVPAGVVPHFMHFTKATNGDEWIIPCANKIYSYNASFTDVTPTGMPVIADEDSWSCDAISGIPLVNHPIIGPHYKDAATPVFKSLPWAGAQTWDDVNKSCNILVGHKQFLFALGLLDGGVERFDSVRWSHPADAGAVPVSWDPLDTTKAAGITALGGNGGRIIGGLSLRDALVVYRERGVNVFDYVGGQYVWRIRQMQTTVGLISKDAVVDVDGTHYFMGYGDVFSNDGNQIMSIASNRIRSTLSSINQNSYKRCFATHYSNLKEVWFCFPEAGHNYSTIALIYNYEYDSWSTRQLKNVLIARIGSLQSTDSIWDNSNESWDGSIKSWDDNASTPFDSAFLGLILNGSTYQLVKLDYVLGNNTEPFSTVIERTDLVIAGLDSVKTVTRIYPHATGSSVIRIQLGSQQYPGGPITWKEPVTFLPGVDRKVDIRSTGSLHAYRIQSTDVEANFILTGLDFEYVEAGTR